MACADTTRLVQWCCNAIERQSRPRGKWRQPPVRHSSTKRHWRVLMKDVIAEVQRQLPGTDKDRYDIAYERGKIQARSALATAGLALGVVVGTALMFFFDPVMGKRRRALLRDKAAAISNDI